LAPFVEFASSGSVILIRRFASATLTSRLPVGNCCAHPELSLLSRYWSPFQSIERANGPSKTLSCFRMRAIHWSSSRKTNAGPSWSLHCPGSFLVRRYAIRNCDGRAFSSPTDTNGRCCAEVSSPGTPRLSHPELDRGRRSLSCSRFSRLSCKRPSTGPSPLASPLPRLGSWNPAAPSNPVVLSRPLEGRRRSVH